MKDKEILENNKLIAEFMNWEKWEIKTNTYPSNIGFFSPDNYFPEFIRNEYYFENEFPQSSLYFNTSWDWLMPVVEKIESLGFNYQIHYQWCVISAKFQPNNECIVRSDDDFFPNTTTLQLTYQTIIEFIKWYNKNKT